MTQEGRLFDPEGDREYNEEERWAIANAAVDRYYAEAGIPRHKPVVSEAVRTLVISSAVVFALVSLIVIIVLLSR